VEDGSRASQRVLTGTLAALAHCASHHRVRSPALLILGEVAALAASELHWFGAAPLPSPATRPMNLPASTLSQAA